MAAAHRSGEVAVLTVARARSELEVEQEGGQGEIVLAVPGERGHLPDLSGGVRVDLRLAVRLVVVPPRRDVYVVEGEDDEGPLP